MCPQEDRSFHTTRWSLVSRIGLDGDSRVRKAALDELCARAWFPIYAFLRRSGIPEHDAEDLTQSFFEYLLKNELMRQAQRGQGRFRSFLLGCLKRFLANSRRKSAAQKRGGHVKVVELDGMDAERRYQVEVEASGATGEGVFDRAWALEILERAMGELRAEENDPARFDLMAQTLTGEGDREALMIATGLGEGSLKVAIHRLRKRFRERLRSLVADTVDDGREVDAELRHLVNCLRM